MNREELKQEREAAYEVWFERWYNKNELEKKIEIANKQGYTSYVINYPNNRSRDYRMMSNQKFLTKLSQKLKLKAVEKEEKNIFGTTFKKVVYISWD